MKKLLAIILSLITAVLASVGLSACGNNANEGENTPPQQSQGTQDNNTNDSNDNDQTPQQPSGEEKPNGGKDDEENNEDTKPPVSDIEFTATEPIVFDNKDFVNRIPKEQLRAGFGHDELKEFKDYYYANLSSSGLCIVDFDMQFESSQCNDYFIYNDLKTGDNLILEYLYVWDRELGFASTGDAPVGINVSISLRIYIRPIERKSEQKFELEFGKYDYYYDYINIYSGDECFATCYYNVSTRTGTISKQWFIDYFTNNLIWGDSL